jgi:2-polyprenyl-3-methyl-5-hydroxy-6-metoxy-1,4-benzoquinol methylase
MVINKCRVCGSDFFKEPLLEYKNMPAVAQYFPDKTFLENDKGIDLEICQCSGCGLIQLNNEPVSYYKEVIRASGISEEMKKFRIKQFQDFLEKYNLKNKKIIEIGCGGGEYLSVMNQLNINSYGLEYSEELVEKCIKIGLKVYKGFIENDDDKIRDNPFDGFFILNYLEHLPKINSTLRGIYNNLTDNAIGLIEVPNFDMILSKNLFSEFTRDHLFYFTKESLKRTLELNGYEVLNCEVIWHDYIISAVVKKRDEISLKHFYEKQEKIKKEIKEYIKGFGSKKVAVWGAGHQALAIMSMTEINKDIKYVIDSAEFKQNKYTPATHIPIVSPETLGYDPVEAIIIIAGSYSDEVASIIKEKYSNKINIAILRDFGLEAIK